MDGGVVHEVGNRSAAAAVSPGMELYRIVPVIALAVALLALLSACGGNGGGY